MTLSTYESTNEKVTKAAELVAQETMIDASNELREGTHADEIKDVAVSCDGTWQKGVPEFEWRIRCHFG